MRRPVFPPLAGTLLLGIALCFSAAAFAGTPPAPPTLTKIFSPPTINEGGTTVLTFTVANPAGAPSLSNVGFVDTLPSGLVVANPPVVGGTCANAAAATTATGGGSTITVTNLQVPAGDATCTVTVNVTNLAGHTNESCSANPAAFTNDSGNVAVTNVVNAVQANCLVVHALPSPALTKAFSPVAISEGGTTVLTFTVANPAGAPSQSNVGFVDTLPFGLVVANPPAVGGTCANAAAATTAPGGGTTITVANLQVPAGDAACTVTVNVTNLAGHTNESCSANPAAFTNDSGNVAVTNVVNAVQANCLVVHSNTPPPPAAVVPALSPARLGFLAATLAAAGLLILRRLSG